MLRATAGGAVEQPSFDALYFGGTLEYQFLDGWYLSATGRYYQDTGEIENSLGGFNSSAPGLDTFQVGLGLRRQKGLSAVKLYLGYYETDYDGLSEDNAFLGNLYADRRWGIFQLTYSRYF